jgi:hypothetical protein
MMSTVLAGPDVRIDVTRWSGFCMPRHEVTNTLAYLAHKVGRSVRCMPYRGSLGYSSDVVNVYVATRASGLQSSCVGHVTIDGQHHVLSGSQSLFIKNDADGSDVSDGSNRILAKVDHNYILLLVEVTGADNDVGRLILAHVVEQAVPLLDFDVDELMQEQRFRISEQYDVFHKSAIRTRIESKTVEVRHLESQVSQLYYQLVTAERDLPMARHELESLEKLTEKKRDPIIEKQADGMLSLISTGQYEEITPGSDGSIFARTSNILIEHDGWVFELGRYEINIDSTGKVLIYSADGTDGDGYPHPHVDSNGRPCLGNISADLAKAIGSMRIFEALTLLYDFISSYNEDGPFIKISKFDSDYDDPDEDPRSDCDDYHTPFCILECSHNDGMHCCSDCGEHRTDYCYTECGYNVPGFNYCSPCDDCEEAEAYCYLECPYNGQWQQRNPCDDCKKSDCDGCDYEKKKLQSEARDEPVPAGR